MKQMKRLLCLALCLVLIAGYVPAPAQAASSEETLHSSGHFYYQVDGDEVIITRAAFDKDCPSDGWPITVTIPEEIEGYPVTQIADSAFWSWYALDTIYLPETLEVIGASAFKACENLVTVDMPHVLSIGDYAFRGCISLEVIEIPSSAEYLGDFAFWECDGIREVSIGEITGKQPDHTLEFDYSSAFYDMGSPVVFKIGSIVKEFDIGYIFRNQLQELWVAKSVNLKDAEGMGIPSDTVVYGYTGSTAESYAEKQGCTFIPLDDDGTADEPTSMMLTAVSPERGGSYAEVSDLTLTFNMTPGRNVYDGSIYIKNYATDETVLELNWEYINNVAVYNGNTVKLPGVLKKLIPGKYYVLIDKGLFTADQVTDDGILYAFPGITQKEYWTFSNSSTGVLTLSGETFQYHSEIADTTKTYQFDYTDEWFFESSQQYNHALAQMSIRMAMAAAWTEPYYIKDLFDKLEFYYDRDSIHYPTPTEDTIGYAIGSRTVTDENGDSITLIAVAVRGGGYGDEWSSNFKVGTTSEHQGFSDAADVVLEGIRSYISQIGVKENIRVWITGYSRAAAVSNLTAHELNVLADSGKIQGLSKDGIYAYCFECPQGIRSDDPGFGNLDRNIFSIVNPIDLVPMVAPTQWKFDRYGITYYLPSREVNYNGYSAAFKKMQTQYGYILDAAGIDESASDFTKSMLSQNAFLTEVTDALTTWMKGQYYYAAWYQDSICDAVCQGDTTELFLDLVDLDIVQILTLVAPEFLVAYPGLTAKLGLNMEKIALAHYPELCLAWMDATSASEMTTDIRTRYLRVNCPVDVAVYDSTGALAVRIVNDEVQEGTVDAYIDENGQKVLVLPTDEAFTVQISATDSGTVSCQVEEYDIASGTATRVVNYYDISVRTGDQITAEIGVQGSGTTDYTLTDPRGNTVSANSDLSGEQVQKHTLTVTAEGNGTVTGGGPFVAGEYAIVTAEPADGERFLGWYVGDTLVSSEPEYRFRVEGDLSLTGTFTAETGATEPDDSEPAQNPFTDVKETDYYYKPVLWAVANNITGGTSATTFSPKASCTRGQIVTFLWAAAGRPEPTSDTNPFTDVKSSAYYYKAVLWAVENGITGGTSATTFSPNNPCTRGQVVTFLWAAKGRPEPESTSNAFSDVKASDYYYKAVLWAVENGITSGIGNGKFGPGNTCTRGQIVTFLYKAFH